MNASMQCIIAYLVSCLSLSAATLQWSYSLGTDSADFDYYVQQVWADGKGGCVAVLQRDNIFPGTTDATVLRFDKHGNVVWSNTYASVEARLGYVDKKTAVLTLSPKIADQTVHVIAKNGTDTAVSELLTDIVSGANAAGSSGDKKGFFIGRDNATDHVVKLQRFTYK
jgi:hypothetical protein